MLVHQLVRNQFETSAEKRVSDYSDWFRTGALYYALLGKKVGAFLNPRALFLTPEAYF